MTDRICEKAHSHAYISDGESVQPSASSMRATLTVAPPPVLPSAPTRGEGSAVLGESGSVRVSRAAVLRSMTSSLVPGSSLRTSLGVEGAMRAVFDGLEEMMLSEDNINKYKYRRQLLM